MTVGVSKILSSSNSFEIVKRIFIPDDIIVEKVVDLKNYLIYNRLVDFCKNCGNEIKIRLKYCSNKCSILVNNANPEKRKKTSDAIKKNWKLKSDEEKESIIQARKDGFKKYGDDIDHNWKIKGARDKIRETFIEKYGVDNPLKVEEIKQRVIATNKERYGNNCPLGNNEILKKSKSTLFKNWGVDNPAKNREILLKIRESSKKTYFKKWGFENPWDNEVFREKQLQNFDKRIKNSFSYKSYTLPSGKIIKVQGYEAIMIDELLKDYHEDEMIFSFDINRNLGKIEYHFDNKLKTYIPDIYIISTNSIYEVKSIWTFMNNIETTLLKAKSCIDKGMNFFLSIIENNIITIINYEQLSKYADSFREKN